MNRYEWAKMDAKYAIGEELWKVLERANAYSEFQSRLEVFSINDYATCEWMGNDGRDLYDITEEQLEQILDDYIDCDELTWCADDVMNNSILSVTGIYC